MLTSRGLGVVLGDLSILGYDARWGVLGARHVGGVHRRDRIWILAYPKELQCDGSKSKYIRQPERQTFSKPRNNNREDIPADSTSIRQSRSREVWRLVREAADYYRETNKPFTDASGRTWPISKPCLCGGDNGLADSVDRLKAIGNGQVPAVAALAWQLLTQE